MKEMKTEDDIVSTKLTEKALRRAAKGVMGEAVEKGKKIPLWDGSKVVWKVPREELADLCAKDECEPYSTGSSIPRNNNSRLDQ